MGTISTCIIVKNEIDNIPKLVDDLKRFSDEIIIVDTGSDDGTYEWLLSNQDSILKVDYFKWIKNFAAARNYSFSKATMDWIFWCDADDRISDKLIDAILEYKCKIDEMPFNAYYINYQFGKEVFVPRLRLLKRLDNPYWTGACHEYVYIDNVNYSYDTFPEDALIVHQHEQGHAPRNLPIFINMVLRQSSLSGRDMYYLSNELRDNGYIDKSIYAAKISLFMPDMCMFDCWNAMLYNLSGYWTQNKDTAKEGVDTINKFKENHPIRGDVHYLLGMLYNILEDEESALKCCRNALNTEEHDIFNYGEIIEYSKIFPAVDLYNKSPDSKEQSAMYEYLKQYSDHPTVSEIFNKKGDS